MSRQSSDQIESTGLGQLCAQQHAAGGIGAAMVRLAKLAEAAHQYESALGLAEESDAIDLRVQGWTPRHVATAPWRGSILKESNR